MRILVVEDERVTASFLRRGLQEEGFAVDIASDGRLADRLADETEYDCIILDIMLPGMDGLTLTRLWRSRGVRTPIILLTARDGVAERVQGLNMGADDYLAKPFAFAELLARVRALLRRSTGTQPAPEIRIGDLLIDTNLRRAYRGGRPLHLSRREFQLLEYLGRNPGRVVTRTELWNHVWDSYGAPDSNVVEVYVRYLRSKLGREPDLVRTVRGEGYVLEGLPTAMPCSEAPSR